MMEIIERHGITIALVSAEEAGAAPWRSAGRRLDVVRVSGEFAEYRPALLRQQFVPKPIMLTWIAELGGSEEEFLAGLATKPRQDIRRAQRRSADGGLRIEVERPPSERSVDRFLELYLDRVATMRHGVTFADRSRSEILGSGRYFGVFAYDGTRLAGSAIVRECPDVDAIRIRFSAVVEDWRRASLARVLYFTAMREARARGFRHATLGDEPNLYGHLTQPGLLAFKSSSGFRAVPSQDFGDPAGHDVADLVVGLTVLNDPSIVLGYADPADGTDRRLTAYLYSLGDPDQRPFSAPFLAGIAVRRPGEVAPGTVAKSLAELHRLG